MGKEAQSEGAVLDQLAMIKQLLISIERQLMGADDPNASAAPVPETADDALAALLQEASEQVIARLQAAEARLAAVEQSLAEKDKKELLRELLMREMAKAGPAQKVITMKAPEASSKPPVDYTPLIDTAVRAVREIAEFFLQGKQQPAPTPAAKST